MHCQSSNVAVGTNALDNLTTGGANIGVGRSSEGLIAGSHNTTIGHYAGSSLTGGNNTFIGAGAGDNCTSVTISALDSTAMLGLVVARTASPLELAW